MNAYTNSPLIVLLLVGLVSCSSPPNESTIMNPETKARPNENVYPDDAPISFGEFIEQSYENQDIEVMLVAYKQEKRLHVFLKRKGSKRFDLFWQHPILATSGKLGPKRKEGDRQVPEGIYHIDRFNPNSRFHLSLGLNYPNRSDRILGDSEEPGSDIFIHGDAVSIGCLAMGDKQIEQIYYLAQLAQQKGQLTIPVLIFPFEMTTFNMKRHNEELPEYSTFWNDLLPAYQSVQQGELPKFVILPDGRYQVSAEDNL